MRIIPSRTIGEIETEYLTRFAVAIIDGRMTEREIKGQTTAEYFAKVQAEIRRIRAAGYGRWPAGSAAPEERTIAMTMRKEKRNVTYWCWRWAKLGPAGRTATGVLAALLIGPAAITLAAVGLFIAAVLWACTLWRKEFGPDEYYRQECRRNDFLGHGYRVYWPGE